MDIWLEIIILEASATNLFAERSRSFLVRFRCPWRRLLKLPFVFRRYVDFFCCCFPRDYSTKNNVWASVEEIGIKLFFILFCTMGLFYIQVSVAPNDKIALSLLSSIAVVWTSGSKNKFCGPVSLRNWKLPITTNARNMQLKCKYWKLRFKKKFAAAALIL